MRYSDFTQVALDTLSDAHGVLKTFLQGALLGFLALETQGRSASITVQFGTSQDFPVYLQLPVTPPQIHITQVTSSLTCPQILTG